MWQSAIIYSLILLVIIQKYGEENHRSTIDVTQFVKKIRAPLPLLPRNSPLSQPKLNNSLTHYNITQVALT